MTQLNEVTERLSRIEELIYKLEKTGDVASREMAKELVQLLLEVHSAGLERIMEMAYQSGNVELIDRFGQDELARSLLLLHGLHPLDLETRVAEGLEAVRPYLRSRGADVELISARDGAVHARLLGNAHGCTASSLKSAVEEALYKAAPDLVSLSVETNEASAASTFVPLTELRTFNGSMQHS